MVAFAPRGTPRLPRLLRRSAELLAKTVRGRASSLTLALSQRERECCHCVVRQAHHERDGGRTISGGLVKRIMLITNLLHYYRKLDYVEY